MKKIFTTLAFLCALILATTALASWSKEYTDENDNEWHIEKETVAVDKNSDGTLEWDIVNKGEIHGAVYNAAILYVQALL